MTIYMVDVSSHNAGVTVDQIKAAGISGMTARAVSFPWNGSVPQMIEDPNYAGWRDRAKALKFPFAAYCLFHTYFTPTKQAAFLASIIGDTGIPVLLDMEPDSSNPTITFMEDCYDACKVANLSPVPLYNPRWYWSGPPEDAASLTGRPWKLVSSNYGGNPTGAAAAVYAKAGGDAGWPGWAPYGGLTPVVGQFGSNIQVANYLLDGDAFKGTVAQLIATGMYTDWSPVTPPTPTPTPPVVEEDNPMYLVQCAQDPTNASLAGSGGGTTPPPANTPWPGIFLYTGGVHLDATGHNTSLTWVPHMIDVDNWKKAGVTGPVVVTWDQWLRICPDNKYTH